MRILAIFFLFFFSRLAAVTSAPVFLRACINNNDSTVTLSWTNISDGCGSFNRYRIYEKVNAGPFTTLTSIFNVGTTEHSFKISNTNTNRSYYITVLYLCDLADSAVSNVVNIDVLRPSQTVLDSVSFDVLTQDIIVGWKANGAADTKGYRLYRNSSGINDSIGQTAGTSYISGNGVGEIFNITISVFDSCDLFAPISSAHRPMALAGSLDSCKAEISLNWSAYVGWSSIDSQALFVSRNHSDFQHYISLTASNTTFIFTDFALGDTLCFYVRAYSGSKPISSSSNTFCFESRALVKPELLYLRQVTVNDAEQIDLKFETDNNQDVSQYQIYKATADGAFSLLSALNSTKGQYSYSYTDANVQVQSSHYSYYVQAIDQCQDLALQSNTGRSILLTTEPNGNFNSYLNWDGDVAQYIIEFKATASSTWNTDQILTASGPFQVADSAVCYRIRAEENINSYGYAEFSYSNLSCIESDLKVFIANTMVLGGTNNRFIVKGQGIDYINSHYEIYNRWGERLIEAQLSSPWYGDYMGEPVQSGIYIYVVKVSGLKGEEQTLKGVLRIID